MAKHKLPSGLCPICRLTWRTCPRHPEGAVPIPPVALGQQVEVCEEGGYGGTIGEVITHEREGEVVVRFVGCMQVVRERLFPVWKLKVLEV